MPPGNDDFASPLVLPGDAGSVRVDNTGATIEPGEPTPAAGNTADDSIWFEWTPATSGLATLSTAGSYVAATLTEIDTVLEVFTGSSLGSLTLVDYNDDSPLGGLTSYLQVPVTAGTTYRIRITTFDNTVYIGPVFLGWAVGAEPPAPSGGLRYGPWITPDPVAVVQTRELIDGIQVGRGFGIQRRGGVWSDVATDLTAVYSTSHLEDDSVQGAINSGGIYRIEQHWEAIVLLFDDRFTFTPLGDGSEAGFEFQPPGRPDFVAASINAGDSLDFSMIESVRALWHMQPNGDVVSPGVVTPFQANGSDTIDVYVEDAGSVVLVDDGAGHSVPTPAEGVPYEDAHTYPDRYFMVRDGLLALTRLDSQTTADNLTFDVNVPFTAFHLGYGGQLASLRFAPGRQVSLVAPTAGHGLDMAMNRDGADPVPITVTTTWQPPRYRAVYTPSVQTQVPLRQFPRDDHLGGSPRQGNANGSTSVQGSARQGWRGTYR